MRLPITNLRGRPTTDATDATDTLDTPETHVATTNAYTATPARLMLRLNRRVGRRLVQLGRSRVGARTLLGHAPRLRSVAATSVQPAVGGRSSARQHHAATVALPHTPALRRALRQHQAHQQGASTTRRIASRATRILTATIAQLPNLAPVSVRTVPAPVPVPAASVTPTTSLKPSATLTDGELHKRVMTLALPAIGEQLLALGVGVSDTFLSGHLSLAASAHLGYGRAVAVEAVGVAVTAVWVVLTAFFAVNIGVTALVARATGARDADLARRAAAQGIVLGAIAGFLMLALAVPLASLITHVLGVSGQIALLGASFIRIFSLGLPAAGIASACTAAMRGSGDARRPLAVMLVVNGINIAASWALVNGVDAIGLAPLGVLGSACGAAAGWTLGAALALFLLSREHPRAPQLRREALRPNRVLAVRILNVGLPSAAELVVFQLGIVSFLRFVVTLGPDAYAANTAINTIESVGSLPGFGFGVATTALVGQALGAADPDMAKRVVWAAMRPCLMVMCTLGLLTLVFPQLLLGIFVADPRVQEAGAVAMRFSFFTQPGLAVAFIFIGALRGAGDTKFPVLVRALGTWGLRVPLALLLIPLWALPGARVAMIVDFWSQAAITYLRFRSGRWRRARV